MNLQHFLVYWSRWGIERPFAADVMAETARRARERFLEMFPSDRVVGVKLAKGHDGHAGEGGRWLA